MKADERFSAGVDGITLAVYVWIAAVFAAVIGAALVFGVDSLDVLGWLADAADTLAGHKAAAVFALPVARPSTVMVRFSALGGFLRMRPAQLISQRDDGRIVVRIWGERSDRVVAAQSVVAQGAEE